MISRVRVGHHGRVTVVLLPAGTVGSAVVLGGAPATREIDLLAPERTVDRVDAVVFTGGSAFGLAAADGVMRFLAERDQGYPTAGGVVPIVPTAAIYDLIDVGDAPPPGPEDGYRAATAAERADAAVPQRGRVGAASGASIGKWKGRDFAVAGGLGFASARLTGSQGDASVAALAVVNAVGDVRGPDGSVLAGSTAPAGAETFPVPQPFEENTTLVAVITDAKLDKAACHLMAWSAHDGMARAIDPPHTRFDGDLAIALATGEVDGHLDRLRATTVELVAAAIADSVAR